MFAVQTFSNWILVKCLLFDIIVLKMASVLIVLVSFFFFTRVQDLNLFPTL